MVSCANLHLSFVSKIHFLSCPYKGAQAVIWLSLPTAFPKHTPTQQFQNRMVQKGKGNQTKKKVFALAIAMCLAK